MSTVATVVLDDVDITPLCIEGTVSTRLNRIGTASVRVNMGPLASYFGTMIPGAGSLLKIYFDNPLLGGPTLWHHGRVLLRELTADANTGYVVFNSSDALELWQHRPVRDFDGDFTDPNIKKLNGISTISGPEMIEAIFDNSINAGHGPPADAGSGRRLRRCSLAVAHPVLAEGHVHPWHHERHGGAGGLADDDGAVRVAADFDG